MQITIEEIDAHNAGDVNRGDGRFTVNARLNLSAENGEIRYTVEPIPPFEKKYPADEVDYNTYVGQPDKTVYLAYADGQIAGQIILRKNWNNYAYIEDVMVDVRFRRQGIGKRLMDHAVRWAKEKNLPGIMLETQNNNVAACRLYEQCGFTLGGFDRYLYRGIHRDTDEIALYWYLLFAQT